MDAREKLEELGYLQFSIQEASIISGVAVKDLSSGDNLESYLRGRLNAQMAVRKSLIAQAADGDIQSQKMFHDLARASEPELEDSPD